MLFNIWIRHVILSSLPMCISLQIIAADEFSGMISLFNNGTVKDTKEIPYCENKQNISLSSYSLRIKQKCSNEEGRCRIQEKSLSPEAVMLLHDRCSLKRECDDLDFATETKEHKNVDFHDVAIRYHCLGGEERLYEMCEDQSEIFKGTVNLMTGKESRQYSSCQCLLKGENNRMIAVTLKDIRLYSTNVSPRKCSESLLKIDENNFACNATSSAFGSIFNQALHMKANNESFTVSLDVKGPDLDMVWLTVEMKGSVSVKCKGKKKVIVSAATSSIKEFDEAPSVNIQSDDSSLDDRTAQPETVLLIAVVGIFAVFLLSVAVAVKIRQTKSKSSNVANRVASAEQTSYLKHDERPDTTYFKIENYEPENQIEKRNIDHEIVENERNTSIGHQMASFLRLLFQRKSNKLPLSPRLERADVSETLQMDNDSLKSARVDIHLAGSSCATEKSPLSDETLKADYFKTESVDGPVQESGDNGRDDSAENQHTYALLNHSKSDDSGLGINENEIYNSLRFKKPLPQTDPTYNHVPADFLSTTYNYLHGKFLSK